MNKEKFWYIFGFMSIGGGIATFFYDSLIKGIYIGKVEIGIMIIFIGLLSVLQRNDYVIERHEAKFEALDNKLELMEYSIHYIDDELAKINEGG